jgi:hypothetical protein
MKRGLIAAAIAVALISSPACFRASVDTDYNADATKLLTGHPKIPATAALAISQEQKDRKDKASKLGIRVTVKTGDSLVGINHAAVGQMFEKMVETDKVAATEGADMIVEPKVNEVETQVHGIGIIIHYTSIAKFSLTAYDKDAKQLWTKETSSKYESENMFGLKALAKRNTLAKETYDKFTEGWKELYDGFYASPEVTGYLKGIGKAP